MSKQLEKEVNSKLSLGEHREKYLSILNELDNSLCVLDNLNNALEKAKTESKGSEGLYESIVMKNGGIENEESEHANFIYISAGNKISKLNLMIEKQAFDILDRRVALGSVAIPYYDLFQKTAKQVADEKISIAMIELSEIIKEKILPLIGLYNLANLPTSELTGLIFESIRSLLKGNHAKVALENLPDDFPQLPPTDIKKAITERPSGSQMSRAGNDIEYRRKLAFGEEGFMDTSGMKSRISDMKPGNNNERYLLDNGKFLTSGQ